MTREEKYKNREEICKKIGCDYNEVTDVCNLCGLYNFFIFMKNETGEVKQFGLKEKYQ